MTAPHADQLIDGYLARLAEAGAGLPKALRAELIADMREHIAEARSREPADETDATILNILDRLGEPGVVVGEARDRLGIQLEPSYRPGILEVAALVLYLLFWPIGIVLLWISPAWHWRDKLLGTLLPPGGYMGVGIIFASTVTQTYSCGGTAPIGQAIHYTCTGPTAAQTALTTIAAVLLLVLPLITLAYLALRLRWGIRRASLQLS